MLDVQDRLRLAHEMVCKQEQITNDLGAKEK